MRDDGELRLRLAAGDEHALGEVYNLHSALVYGVAKRVTADAEAAWDVTQEVFVGLWERPLAFDPGRGSLRTWLVTLAHRRAVDWVRKESRHRRPPPVTEREGDAGPGVEENVLAGELARSVKRAMDGLPDTLRHTIELAYYRGLTYREVADALSIPEGTAKSRIRNALARLGQGLEKEGFFS
ncbi:sigma-70 family RNA polymerase sigma factor [Actinomadura barringtoniae]|uniref:Sigma-70 family RNA polymerase sigma factor n=1 Tax=Actinomadura barringtoniae TaxID=1427535 RepID=A0A939PKJ7_9ACTN|nr:sigma-70 family RNA polymerase sigma factor [Actinomadura barringtoniae]MBO2454025.1 sigma-70 family RNA polymerase sigma factor [Actinomadura barringtoniae]